MKLDMAIKILEQDHIATRSKGDYTGSEALRIGIEAMKAVKHARNNNYWTPIPTLPGETEEE